MSLTPKEVKDRLLKTIDEAIEKGQWDSSLFLKNILKQLQTLRAQVAQELSNVDMEKSSFTQDFQQIQKLSEEREGHKRVYIALYQAESGRLDRWLASIKMLVGYSVSRPVYSSEEDVAHMIREKQSKNDAYVSVWVKQSDIIPPHDGMPLKDRWGHELLTLKEGSFRLQNIIEFVHGSSHYRFSEQGGLVLHNWSSSTQNILPSFSRKREQE